MQLTLYAAAAFAAVASAHYTFSSIKVNGVAQGSDWTYFRQHTRGYQPTYGNEIASNDFRCQPGAESGGSTKTLTVKGGDKIFMGLAFAKEWMDHPGPGAVFMSKAPGNSAASYDGSGDWFKVFDSTLCSATTDITTTAWCTYHQPGIEFTIPTRLPDGEYLIRPQHIGLHGAQGDGAKAQFFYSCAQIKIQGNSAGTSLPTRTVKIPGNIKEQEDGVKLNIWYPTPTSYPYRPGGALIVGGQSEGDSTGSTKSVVVNKQKRAIGGGLVARAKALLDH